MTTPLSPELHRLDTDYNTLVDNVEAGHTTQAEALSVLSGMSATDADGAVWTISPEGDFMRADHPGATAEPADPADWALPGAVHSTMPRIPFDDPADRSTQDAPWQLPDHPQPSPGRAASRTSVTSQDARPPHARPDWIRVVLGKARANAIVIGIAIIGIIAIIATLPAGSAPDPGPLAPLPGATSTSTTPAPTALGTLLPSVTKAPTGPSVVGLDPETLKAAGKVPTGAQARAVISALGAGKSATVASLAATKPDRKTLARAVALWAGAADTGLTVTGGPAAAAGSGAVQTWTIADGSATITKIKVTWIVAAGYWRLTVLPTF